MIIGKSDFKIDFRHIMVFLSFVIFSTGASCQKTTEFTISNQYLSRTITTAQGQVRTVKLLNKVAGKEILPQNDLEFQLRIADDTQGGEGDVVLTSKDFRLEKVLANSGDKLSFLLTNQKYKLEIELVYELAKENFFLHKYLNIKAGKPVVIKRIDLETIALNDIYQPYQMKQITAEGPAQWRPGLGQPLYTKESATFWGTEFPASFNFVENSTAYCGYLYGREIGSGETYTSYKSVVGVGDDSNYIQDTFFDYIDKIRIRPLRLQVQYNSWFDFWSNVTSDKFAGSVKKVAYELNEKRGVAPFSAYVVDDGWQNARTDWSDKVWKVNTDRFDPDFRRSFELVKSVKSGLGLWLSPGCNFGGRPAVPLMREKGLEALDEYMSLAGPKYMQLLEDRMVELTRLGVGYFKLDGLFGHLNRREFDLNTARYGVKVKLPAEVNDFKPGDERLNDPKYDELKTYYLVAGTERLMQIFRKQHQVNPNVYIVISNGAYLSPWWLQYVDAVWMINAGDAAGGSNRNQELVYRDGVYYDTWMKENTQFPINSIFNHEPKKTQTGESAEQFSEYLWMNLSRGTGFVELYIKTDQLSESDWDVLASGLKWVHKVFPYFKHSKMHGGSPKEGKVYGYTGWNENGGYISFHNPSETNAQTYRVKLDRALGITADLPRLEVTSPLTNAKEFVGKTVSKGDTLEVTLAPGEVKVLEFTKTK